MAKRVNLWLSEELNAVLEKAVKETGLSYKATYCKMALVSKLKEDGFLPKNENKEKEKKEVLIYGNAIPSEGSKNEQKKLSK